MTAQATLKCLPVNNPKPITSKLMNSQSQAKEITSTQNAMQLTYPIKELAEPEKRRWEEVEM